MSAVNAVERLQGQFELHERRMRRLEDLFATRLALKPDEREAALIAQKLGLGSEVLFLPRVDGNATAAADREAARARASARRTLARELAKRGWSVTRIARVFYCAERTATRWLK